MKYCSGWLQHHQLRAPVGGKDKVGITAPYPAKTRSLIPFRGWLGLSNEEKSKLISKYPSLELRRKSFL